jgi:sialate O-acetylesterase
MMRYFSVMCLFLSLNTVFSQAPSQAASGQLTVCRLFSDHGVLQRQKPLPVWGKSKPNDTILVKLGTQSRSTVADTEGS